jgi:hypothetical protein
MAFGDFTVTRASTKNVLGSAGLYVSVANNVPAFEFNTDGSYRGLLVEPGATNLFQRSQEFDDGFWTKTNLNTTGTPPWVNVGVAPDGATTAEKITEDTATGLHGVSRTGGIGSAGTYTISLYVKASERTRIAIGNSSLGQYAVFDASDGTVPGAGGGTVSNAKLDLSLPNGWYRFSCVLTVTGATSVGIFLVSTGTTISYAGDGTSGIFLWQAQLETGSVATSPIVTTAGTASRVADVVSLTGASSLIGQAEGTIYAEVELSKILGQTTRSFVSVEENDENRLFIGFSAIASNTIALRITDSNVIVVDIRGVVSSTGIIKVACAYKNNDSALYINGETFAPTTNLTFANTNSIIRIGSVQSTPTAFLNDYIRSVALFPTRLANATLETLTTL